MVALQPLVSEFTIVGRLEDFVISSKGRIKYLSLSTPEEDYSIAVAKSPKNVLSKYLKPGCHLKVTGMRKCKLDRAEIEYKAYRIELLPEQASLNNAIVCEAVPQGHNISFRAPKQKKAKILVCQGSSCGKQGAQAICKLLQTELKAKGITNEVEIKTTGCMKQCKQAPVLIMPGRNSYSRVKPLQISQLVSKHLE